MQYIFSEKVSKKLLLGIIIPYLVIMFCQAEHFHFNENALLDAIVVEHQSQGEHHHSSTEENDCCVSVLSESDLKLVSAKNFKADFLPVALFILIFSSLFLIQKRKVFFSPFRDSFIFNPSLISQKILLRI